jgi:hypothetical protein
LFFSLKALQHLRDLLLIYDGYALILRFQKILTTMMPSEEEKAKIRELQLGNPDIPLGPAENFLLTIGSISELQARLRLWAFTLDYNGIETVTYIFSTSTADSLCFFVVAQLISVKL